MERGGELGSFRWQNQESSDGQQRLKLWAFSLYHSVNYLMRQGHRTIKTMDEGICLIIFQNRF
jgi:hypothetical protein